MKPIYKQFWHYTLPTVAAMLVNGLYQIIDGVFIGQYVGADGLAGINVAWPLIGAVLGIGMMVGVGAGAIASISQGAGEQNKAKDAVSTGLAMLLIIYPILALLLYLYADDLLMLQGVDGHVFELGKQYLDIVIVTNIVGLGGIALPFLLRNDNSPKLATGLMVLGACLNIVLDYLFIGVLNRELAGAAIATSISQGITTVIGVWYFFSKYATMRLSFKNFKIRIELIPQILTIGLSSFFMYAYGSAMVAVHNWMFTQYGSVLIVGAYAIIGYIVTIYYLTVEGVANGMQPLVSFNHGAQKPEKVGQLLGIAMWTAIVLGVAFIGIVNLFPETIISVFNDEDPELLAASTLGIRLHMFTLFLDGFIVVAAAYYQAVGKSQKAMFTTVGNMLAQLPFLYLLPMFLGLNGVWLAYPISNILVSLILFYVLRKDIRYLNVSSDKVVCQTS
ncbi:MATE family efflux transporter [Vibrio hannami]|uniref:MATE family efflux transporter n=1 Tax=Vibrio hannami TaxID=2717094 RepID=UPI00240FD0FE|nr:MATE family efflux transporter [Vibrio hannami]MDG3088916.1 MATE family efflux transporter [Vibrio hannami]